MSTIIYKPTAEETAEAIAHLKDADLLTGGRLYMTDEGTAARSMIRVYVVKHGDIVNITHWVGRATGRGQIERGGRMGIPVSGYNMSRMNEVAYALSRELWPNATSPQLRWEAL